MAKLTKEEVISTLQQALSEQQGKAVTIEQNGSWYKIDGGKSLRFAELEQMLADSTKPAKAEAKQEKPKAAKLQQSQPQRQNPNRLRLPKPVARGARPPKSCGVKNWQPVITNCLAVFNYSIQNKGANGAFVLSIIGSKLT